MHHPTLAFHLHFKYYKNLAVTSQIAIANVLADLNLVVWYGIAMHIILYASKKFRQIINLRLLKQTAKLPNLISRQIFRLYGIQLFSRYTSSPIFADPGSASGPHPSAFIWFSHLSYLGHLSPLWLQTRSEDRACNSATFSFKFHIPKTSMSSVVNGFVHAIHKCSKKCLA